MDNNIKESQYRWDNHPFIIFTELLILYTAINSIAVLLNL